MTKKQKDMAEFCADFVKRFLIKDDEYIALDSDMKILVLSMCAASVGMLLKYLGIQPIKKVLEAEKPKSKKKESIAKA